MRRNAVSSIVLMLAFAAATRAHGSSVNISMNADKEVRTCGDVRIQFDGRAAQRAEDNFTLPAGTPLSVRLPVNSGIRVTGTNRSDFAVTVCKAADRAEASTRFACLRRVPGSHFADRAATTGRPT
jgi:hypothetical protein